MLFDFFALALTIGVALILLPGLRAGADAVTSHAGRAAAFWGPLCSLPLLALALYVAVGRPDALQGHPAVPDTDPVSAPAWRIEGSIEIAPSLRDRVPADAIVLVIAKDTEGNPMPLAVSRIQSGKWPLHFRLDESMAMMEGASLQRHRAVNLIVRISRTGQAKPVAGDMEGRVDAVEVGATTPVKLTINDVLP